MDQFANHTAGFDTIELGPASPVYSKSGQEPKLPVAKLPPVQPLPVIYEHNIPPGPPPPYWQRQITPKRFLVGFLSLCYPSPDHRRRSHR